MADIGDLVKAFHQREPQRHSAIVYRLAAGQEPTHRQMGIMNDRTVADDDAAAGGDQEDPSKRYLVNLISEPFRRNVRYPQRWNTTYPCFYASLESETSVAEMKHYTSKRLLAETKGPVHYILFCAEFDGKVVDVAPLTQDYPQLVEDSHNSYCHCVADEARKRRLDALLARSVRRSKGTCVPVYSRQALSPGEVIAKVRYYKKKNGYDIGVRVVRLSPSSKGQQFGASRASE